MDKVKILIVDDHAILRDGIRALLGVHEQIDVVGEAADGREGIEKALETEPDVILMDLVMPGMDGLEATRQIRKKIPKAKVLFLTQYEAKEYVQSAINAGGHGYIPKKALAKELLKAIWSVVQGDYYLYPSIIADLIKDYVPGSGRPPHAPLTAREKEVLKLVAEGHTSQKISKMLDISPRTVSAHRAKIMKKLNTPNRTELIKYAIDKRIVTLDT